MLELAPEGQLATVAIGDLPTEAGAVIHDAHIAYRRWGAPAGDPHGKNNILLVEHALTGDSDATDWWCEAVGPGKALDTDEWCVICTNALGSCYGSTGPASEHPDGGVWGSRFPAISIRDQVRAEAQFLESLFGTLPEFFKDEAELREVWGLPETRKKLLEGLAQKGFGPDQLRHIQKIIEADQSDLFDVLAHIAFAKAPLTRQERAANAKALFPSMFDEKQQTFLDFVLKHYVNLGVQELDHDKLGTLLELKYDGVNDAVKVLGPPDQIRQTFVGFQRYLYSVPASTQAV